MIRIEMRYTDEYGNTTSLDKETTVYPDLGIAKLMKWKDSLIIS